MPLRIWFAAGLLALVAGCQVATTKEAGLRGAILGSDKAAGVVIWMHGTHEYKEPGSYIPRFVREFESSRFDIYQIERPRAIDKAGRNADLLVSKIREFRAQGYKKVVLIGQSCGAWASLKAATISDEMDAVIATAPACHGTRRSSRFMENSRELFEILNNVKTTRIMLFFFENDEYDPGGRGIRAENILADRDVIFEIFDRPAGFSGHGAASNRKFARRFGRRIVRFVNRQKDDVQLHDISIEWAGRPALKKTQAIFIGRNDMFTVANVWDGKTCLGSLGREGETPAQWSLVCPPSRLAFGDLAASGSGGTTIGSGKDLLGNPVKIILFKDFKTVSGLRFVN